MMFKCNDCSVMMNTKKPMNSPFVQCPSCGGVMEKNSCKELVVGPISERQKYLDIMEREFQEEKAVAKHMSKHAYNELIA